MNRYEKDVQRLILWMRKARHVVHLLIVDRFFWRCYLPVRRSQSDLETSCFRPAKSLRKGRRRQKKTEEDEQKERDQMEARRRRIASNLSPTSMMAVNVI